MHAEIFPYYNSFLITITCFLHSDLLYQPHTAQTLNIIYCVPIALYAGRKQQPRTLLRNHTQQTANTKPLSRDVAQNLRQEASFENETN
jgi:hypothetical protein